MKLVTDYNTLVIVGMWNRHIFNQEWIGKFLLPETKLSAEFPINIVGSVRVSTDNLRIYVIGDRLYFAPLKTEIAVFDLIQDLALKVGSYLPHTPVNSFGVNFLFEAARAELRDDIFKLPDLSILAANSLVPFSTSYRYAIKKDNRTLNLSASIEGDVVKFDFNNHFELSSLVDFKEKLSQTTIVSMLKDAETVLKNIYIKQ